MRVLVLAVPVPSESDCPADTNGSGMVDVDDLVDSDGAVVLAAETVDVSEACRVLAQWDGRYDLDSSGAILWRETMSRFDNAARTSTGSLLGDAFDPARPTRTPAQLAGDVNPVLQALARAVQTLTKAGFAADSRLGSAQFTQRSETRISLHGGTNVDGVTNIVDWRSNRSSTEPVPTRGDPVAPGSALRGEGYPVNYGSSFIMTVDYSGDAVQAWAILTYGETSDRNSPLFDQQMARFSEKNWREVAFTEDQITADPQFTEQTVVGP